jgi:predicted Zn-dependent protease
MYATLALLGGSLLLLMGYLAYHRLIMPVPVELGAGGGMPTVEIARTDSAEPRPLPPLHVSAPVPAPRPPAPAATTGAVTAAPPAPASATAAPTTAASAPEQAPAGPAPSAAATAQPPATDNGEAASMLQAAHALYERGRRKEALAAYEQVLALDPQAPAALSRIAYLHLDSGDDALAQQYAARAVELDPTSSEGWIVLGAAREALRDRAGARDAYQRCAATGVGPFAAECRRLAR